MINFLVGSLLSFCLLSPVQSPDCAGGVGVSVPSDPSPVVVQLPVPLPLPPVPGSPVQIVTPPLPAPVPVVPAVPVPAAPLPQPAPIPVPALPGPEPQVIQEAPVPAPEPVIPPAPEPAPVELAPAITASPAPVDVPYDGLSVIKETNEDIKAEPAPESKPETRRPGWLDGPFDDGSVGAAIGNTVLQFPDFGVLLLVICILGIILLTENLDEAPKVPDKSELFD